jgi:drug/metabolite transporter (DMT)-like permease
MSYALKLAGAGALLVLLGVLGIVLLGEIWQQIGLGAAVVVVFGGLLFYAWRVDKKDKARRGGIDELPPV